MIKCEHVNVEYKKGSIVLEDVNIAFEDSGIYLIIGGSGTGKSTLISSILGLKKPSSGKICYDDVDIYSISEKKRVQEKNKIGYVAQNFTLIDSISVIDNICIASVFSDTGNTVSSEYKKAEQILKLLNISNLKNVSPNKISGGEKRRVEIARAFIRGKKAIVMDEPTNNLDDKSVELVKELAIEYNRNGVMIIISTHDARIMDLPNANFVSIAEGKVVFNEQKN